jgi:23S rRNA-/tRNA-specific pseudouridylate synthase
VQLNAGEIARDYVILCHGWMRPCLKDIKTKVYWRGLLPTSSGDQGKPSLTRLKVTAHARHRATALSLVAVRIATGRKLQIRSHFSHVGHPTACDGKYTAEATFLSDQELCARNFLHRYRLAFKDLAGKDHEVMMPVPADLMISLQRVTSRDIQSAETIRDWVSGSSLRSWQDYTPLTLDVG